MELWAPTYKWFLGPTLYFRLVCCSTLEIVDLQTTSESPLGDGFRYFWFSTFFQLVRFALYSCCKSSLSSCHSIATFPSIDWCLWTFAYGCSRTSEFFSDHISAKCVELIFVFTKNVERCYFWMEIQGISMPARLQQASIFSRSFWNLQLCPAGYVAWGIVLAVLFFLVFCPWRSWPPSSGRWPFLGIFFWQREKVMQSDGETGDKNAVNLSCIYI